MPHHGKVGAGMARAWPVASVRLACVRLVLRSYSACIPPILLDSFPCPAVRFGSPIRLRARGRPRWRDGKRYRWVPTEARLRGWLKQQFLTEARAREIDFEKETAPMQMTGLAYDLAA